MRIGAAIRYFGKDYLLSYRYFAPLLAYGFSLSFIYSVIPNPVMPSYSFTSTVLFIITAWLALGYIDTEHETQQVITSLHMHNLHTYYICKVIPIGILIVLLSLVDIIYPILFNKFDRSPTLEEMIVAFLCHLTVSLLGMSAGFLCTRRIFPKWYSALGGLIAFIVISLAVQGIIHSLPPVIQFVEWLLPPLYRTMDLLNNYDSTTYLDIVLGILMPLLYALVLLVLFITIMVRKRF
jgi:ABC-type xylose transport system permease subunit